MAISDDVLVEPSVRSEPTGVNTARMQSRIQLPKIELPSFDGSILEWRSFRDIYISLVHNNESIDDAERFHYLISRLSGSALSVIKSVPLTAANYAIAWGALSDRFDNKRLLASAHLDKLFAFKPIVQESLPALMEFVNTFKENVSIIKSIGVDDLAGFLLFHMGSRVLDPTTLRLFESSISQSTIPEFGELLDFVQQRCKILENLKLSNKIENKVDHVDKWREKAPSRGKSTTSTKSVLAVTTSSPNKSSIKFVSRNCVFCDHADHNIYQCPKFNELSVEKRRDIVVKQKLCFACLNPTHMVKACSSKGACRSCSSKQHHSLLHLTSYKSSTTETPSTSENENSTSFVGAARTNSTVVLGTAVVHIKDAWGQTHAVRALLDSGSQLSAMTNNCSARLGLPRNRFQSNIVGLGQSPVTQIQGVTKCQFTSHFDSKYVFPTVDLVVLPHITAAMPSAHLPSNAGVEHYAGIPSALDTKIGWIIFGSFSTSNTTPLVALTTAVDQSIDDQLSRFWEIEEPAASVSPTTEEQWCETFFKNSTSRDSSGRFCVAFPFHDLFTNSVQFQTLSPHGLGESRSVALKRFHNLERRLAKDAELYAAYRQFMSTYLRLGHMVLAPEPGKYFIPHHAVLKADGDMSKIRVVFDASSVSSSGRSLNDVLCTGPKLQVDLRDILLRSRLHRFILTADIVKMYRQILIRSEDRVFQHIFWRDSPSDNLQEYQLCTITYGLNCAPYLAIRCLHELDEQDGHLFPLAKGVLNRSAYVDDIVVGADTEEQLLRRKEAIVGLLHNGACELSKWTSNSALVLGSISPDHRANSVSFDPRDEHSVKVLGLHWNTTNDSFAYHTSIPQASSTKRQVLSIIARLFDPIGALGPLLLWAKYFMQSLWGNKLGWDDPMPEELLSTWRQFCLELPAVFELILPRHFPVTSQQDIQLLGFADASTKGYAATIYLRIVNADGDVSVKLVTCKTKVAPLRAITTIEALSTPRLELCGALLLAQTLQHTHYVLSSEISISRIRAWSDSSIVLSWLTSDQKYFKIFITNRVAKIHRLIPDCEWNHVSTSDNPADPASRGLLPRSTVASRIYWNGPDFLQLPEEQWPKSKLSPLSPDQLPETRPNITTMLTVNVQSPSLELFSRFSSLSKLQRVMSFVLRFLRRLRHQSVNVGPLTLAEREAALRVVVQRTQQHYFSDLSNMLRTKSAVTPSSLAQLAPYTDVNGVIRVGGRLRFSDVHQEAKHPILLPRSSYLTDLLIRHYHLTFLHGGPKLIISMLSQKFWILSSRAAVLAHIGNDEQNFPKANTIEDKANMALVFMFQPLCDNYTQPVAVFASRGPVHGTVLAQLLLKFIILVEKAGAKVHGFVCDGATTNRKLWSELGINGKMNELNNSFIHPLDTTRKLNGQNDPIRWDFFEKLYNTEKENRGLVKVCPSITKSHVYLNSFLKMKVKLATQIFSESVATALEYYKLKNYPEFQNSSETTNFCRKINCLFDSLNNLNPYHGLSVDSEGWKNIKSSINWLDDWEMALKEGEITEEEFLPPNTSQGLRITMSSMLDMSLYLIDKFDFKYILSGRINQDNLEIFFGTIRAAGGQNDHPAMPNFQHIYKMLSVYSILKPPKSGNCTVIEHNKNLIKLEELKNIFDKPKATAIDLIKEKLNESLLNIDDIHEIEVFDIMSESLSPFNSTDVVDCIIYYIAGYFTKQVSTSHFI
ncbi:uncharacterized protein LOC103307771 [Acyrthosiphon pisum]|uniref:Uncharacterized protein n=1 Tax=Acyrthosiphon pisum TaxID=7029 RepID=A0A8R1X0G6_ACYPI|nr:uncharacterized protein LOC103307771 [Acyrthosiphon pisum]|eukprot:XP_008178271.1 PREDICTED: uncharacterized protein LOC103307771 [Acyrthosiphon pisum]